MNMSVIVPVLADVAGGAWIFIGIIGFALLAIIFGYWTRKGSGINQRPWGGGSRGGAEGAPGAEGRSRVSSAERDEDVPRG